MPLQKFLGGLGLSLGGAALAIALVEGGFSLLNRTGLRAVAQSWSYSFRSQPMAEGALGSFADAPILTSDPPPFLIPRNLPLQQFDKPFYHRSEGLLRPPSGVYSVRGESPDTGEILYQAKYSIGERRFRISPGGDGAEEFAIFLGDSFVFGIGVSDHETLPSAFMRNAPGFRAYNFGFGGDGPNDQLVRAWREVPPVRERSGLVIFLHQNYFPERLFGGFNYLGTWGAEHPLVLRENGKIVHRGPFRTEAPWRVRLAKLWAASAITSFWHLDWPPPMGANEARFYAEVIAEIRNAYAAALPGGRFLFVFGPGEGRDRAQLLPELKSLGIEVLDYSGVMLERYLRGPRRIPQDGHHTPEANAVFGERLAVDVLRLLGNGR
jgi:hypothetical protein